MRLPIAAALAVLSLTITASSAHAATVRANVSIQGTGLVSASGYSGCSQTTPWNWATKACEKQHVVSNDPSLDGVSTTLTAATWGQWEFVRWDGCESTSNNRCTVSAGAFTARNWSPKAIFVDRTAPRLTFGPSETYSPTDERTVSFAFTYDEGVYAECRIGANAFQECGSGVQYTLPEGDHVFDLQAWDSTGNYAGSVSRGFKIVDTAIDTGPANGSLTNSRTALFGFSTVAGNTFECRLDGGPWSTCPGPTKGYAGLADGTHIFDVRAVNGGYFDRIPARRTWHVDGTAPVAALVAHAATPGEGVISSLTTATFAFDAPGALFYECSLDGAPFTRCTSPVTYSRLPSGPHKFRVRATDLARNVGPVAERMWVVAVPDLDSDGYNALADCNDRDTTVNPGRPEILNNTVDENCDGKREFDRDLDGARADRDCADTDPRRTPGKAEIPGNGIDDDCDGVDKLASMTVSLGSNWDVYSTHTILKGLTLNGAPVGSKVLVVCKGKKCPRKKLELTTTKPRQPLKKFSGKRLRPGTRLVVTVSHAGYATAVKTLKIRSGKRPLISVG